MKRNSLFFLLLLFMGTCSAQSGDIVSQNKLAFSLEGYKSNMPKVKTLDFVLSIRNISGEVLSIPNEYVASPGDDITCSIFYEIYRCTKSDTVDVSEQFNPHSNHFDDPFGTYSLSNESAFLFTTTIPSADAVLKKKGRYKIRFTLKQTAMEEFIANDLTTDWIYFDLK